MTNIRDYRMLIDGEWVGASDGALFDGANPATGEVWSRVPEATVDDVEAIAGALAGMEAALRDWGLFLESDLQFHLLIARATHNSILYSLLETTRNHLQEWIKGNLSAPSLAGPRAELSLREHHQILMAMRKRDPEGARQAMAAHIRSSGRDLQEQVGAD